MIGLCLVVAAVTLATVPATDFTLAWTHSVEKLRWEEDYRVVDGALVPVSARVRGSGAGMEPPDDAVLRHGVWHYRPRTGTLPELHLTVSPFTSDYELCWSGQCVALADQVAMRGQIGVVELHGCKFDELAQTATPGHQRQ